MVDAKVHCNQARWEDYKKSSGETTTKKKRRQRQQHRKVTAPKRQMLSSRSFFYSFRFSFFLFFVGRRSVKKKERKRRTWTTTEVKFKKRKKRVEKFPTAFTFLPPSGGNHLKDIPKIFQPVSQPLKLLQRKSWKKWRALNNKTRRNDRERKKERKENVPTKDGRLRYKKILNKTNNSNDETRTVTLKAMRIAFARMQHRSKTKDERGKTKEKRRKKKRIKS